MLDTIGNQWMVKRELLGAGETKDVKIEPWQTMGGHQMIWARAVVGCQEYRSAGDDRERELMETTGCHLMSRKWCWK